MNSKPGLCALVASLSLGVAITFGPVATAGSGAKAQELDWATSAGGADPDAGTAVATDPRGNSYVTGRFAGTAMFGAGEDNETVLTAADNFDVFVAKYAPDGPLLWATSAGGASEDVGSGVATDPRGNSYVTGRFFETATFGAGEDNETVLTPAGDFDVFVAKYAPDGTLLWATRAGGAGGDLGFGIATDPRGNSYVTGRFADTATFGAGEDNETVLTAVGFSDVFVAKYAPDGTLLWATSAGGADFDQGSDIATDPRGDTYVTGGFVGTATFGAGEDNETVLTAAGELDVFLAKYAWDGTLLWATSAGGAGLVQGPGVVTDPRGNSYLTGLFDGTVTFGADEDNETVLTAAGGIDVFVAKYARDGMLLWATSAGGADFDQGGAIATDLRGNSYVTGGFQSTATFGAGEDNETVLTAAGGIDVFVAKYAPDGMLLWARSAGGASEEVGTGVATDPRGNSYVTGRFFETATFGAGEDNETVLTAAGSTDVFVAKYLP